MSAYNGKTPIGNVLSKPVSRRHFFSLSAVVGSLSVIGMTSTNKMATIAYADEAGNVHYNVVEINREEIPVLAVDVSKNSEPISGMEVKATSYDLQVSKGIEVSETVVTDEAGTATINVRKLSEDSEELLDNYFAGLSIIAQKDGYQIYEDNYNLAFSGGNFSNIQIATKPIKKDTPYASCLSLSGYDMAYRWQQVAVSVTNDYEYDLYIKLRNFPKSACNQEARLTLTSDRKEIAINNISDTCVQETVSVVKGQINNDGVVEFYVKGVWFNDGDSMPHEGSKIIANVSVNNFGKVLVVPKLKCTSGEFFANNSFDINHTLRLGSGEGIATTENAEDQDNFKTIEGEEGPKPFYTKQSAAFNLAIPIIGMEFWNDGQGSWGLSVKFTDFPIARGKWRGKKRVETTPSKRKFSAFPDSGWSKWNEDMDWKLKDVKRHFASNKKFGMSPICRDFDISLALSGALVVSVLDTQDSDNKNQDSTNAVESKAVFSIQPEAYLSFESTWTVFVGFIPIGVCFNICIQFKADFAAGSKVVESKSHSIEKMTCSGDTTCSATAVLFLEAGLSVGIGIKGFIGAFVRGYANIAFTLAFGTDVSKNPEFDIDWDGAVEVVVELIVFTKNIILVRRENGQLYTNHKESLNGNIVNKGANEPFEYSKSETDFEMITEDMLRGVLESVVTLDSNGWARPSNYTSNHPNVVSKFNSKNLGNNFGIVQPYNNCGQLLYNPQKGFRIEYDHIIAKDVFFSSHMTTFMYQGELYLLRISSVEIDVPNNKFKVYSNGVSNFIVADQDAQVPRVKRDKNNNVLLDANQNVIYDIPAGMNKDDVAVFGDDCFEDMQELNNASKQERVNAFFNMREAKGQREKAFLNNKKLSNSGSVVRTRVTCSKYNLETGEWTTPNVIDFAVPSTGNVVDERYNCFDTDMDVAVNNSQVQIVLTGTTRADVQITDPKMEQVFQTQHVYSLTYNVITGEVKNVVVHAGNVHYSPKMPAFDWFSCYKHPWQANDLSDAGLYLYDNNYGNTMLNSGLEWGDKRIDDYLSTGVYENHIVGETKSVNTYSTFTAWYSSSEPENITDTNYGGLAAFWTTYIYEDVTGHHEIRHHFNFLERCVDTITFLGEAPHTSENFDRCMRYLVARTKDVDNQRRYDVLTFYFNSKTGTFSPDYTRSHDLFGSLKIAKIYPGQDANHLYAARITDEPSTKIQYKSYSDDDKRQYYGTKGPFSSGMSCIDDPNETGSLYQIIEGRWSEKYQTFFHMFPITQFNYNPDSIEYLTADDYIKYFMVTNVSDFKAVKGNIHIVGIPYIKGIKLDEFNAGNENIQPGDSSYVDLVVSNVGTMPISGYTVSIQVNDDQHEPYKIYDNKKLEDLSPYFVLEELANYKSVLDPETGKPVVDPATEKASCDLIESPLDDEGILWPGTTRTFRFNFTLPEDYEGEVVIRASVKDPVVHEDSLFSYERPEANNREIISWHDPRELEVKVDSSPIVNMTEVSVSEVDYQIIDERGKVIDETDPKHIADGDSPLGHLSSSTADSTPVKLGLGALAVGATAAGIAAYEKRRAENENSNNDEC